MPQADGTILIDTEINADGMKAGSKEVEESVRRMASSVDKLGTKAKTALNKQVDSFVKLNQEFAAQSKKVDELKKKVAEYGNQKIPTQEYKEIQSQIDAASKKMERLIDMQEKFLAMGGSQNSKQYKSYQYDIDQLANTIKYAQGELEDLEETGKAFSLGNQTKQAAADMEKLASAERKLADMNNRLGTSYSAIKGKMNDYNKSLTKMDSEQKKASASGNKIAKSLTNTAKATNKASFGIGKMLGTSILFSFVFQAINGAMTALTEGFTNLAKYSSTTNNSISMLWSSLERLKNSLATAFAPILDVIAPILSRFIDMISTAASYVSMFFAILQGKGSYTRAIAVQKDYAASLDDSAGSAEDLAGSTEDTADATDDATEAAERYLSPLDDINRFTEDQSKSSGSPSSGGSSKNPSGSGVASEGPLFEEVPIDNKFSDILDSIIDKLKDIRDIFMSGFWDGLGDYNPVLAELKSDLESIGNSLKEIFSDPQVVDAASNFAKAWIYALGQISGSAARIGLTIAQNLVGGFEKFLNQEKDRIKEYLVGIFDVGAEIGSILGDLSVAVADIFSVFGSDVAQQITGNVMSIFAELGMMLTENATKLGRDILTVIAQPIIENKDLIKDALMSTLEAIEPFTSGILSLVQRVRDGITDIYDNHLKPFFDSIADGFSEIFGNLLEGYNTYMVPVLDGLATKFQELMDGPVGTAIDQIVGLISRLIDFISILWQTILVPFFAWIAENIMPVLAPIVQFIGENVLNVFSLIAQAIGNLADILSGILDFLSGVFTGDWELAWKGIQEIFDGVWNLITDFLSSSWETIKTIISNGIEIAKAAIKAGWNAVKTVTSSTWNAIKDKISSIWSSIKSTASNAVQWISDKVSNIFEGMKNKVSGIFESLVDIVTQPLNWIIDKLNGLISAAESAQNWIADALSFSIDIPWPVSDFVGFDNFTIGVDRISLPRIPYLASGAVIPPNKEFMAVLGDQKQGNNIEAPESLLRRIVREESGNGGVQRIEVPVYLNRREIARATVDEAKLMRLQTGKNPFELA